MDLRNMFGINTKSEKNGFNFKRDWENQDVTQINREMSHTPWGAYESAKQALTCDRGISKNVMSLDGVWKFQLASRPEEVTEGFWEKDFDVSKWHDIKVPGNWEVHGFGYPIYTNYINPFTLDGEGQYLRKPSLAKDMRDYVFMQNPPYVPNDNPTGCYVRKFEMPREWLGKSVFVNFGGVESCFYLWVNGKPVGYSQDSKLPSDFDITPYVSEGSNTIALQVMRWCDGVYLEDQDYWYISGIFRSVRLIAKPKIHIKDFFVRATPEECGSGAVLRADVNINTLEGFYDYKVRLQLFDMDKLVMEAESSPHNSRNMGTVEFCLDIKEAGSDTKAAGLYKDSKNPPYRDTNLCTEAKVSEAVSIKKWTPETPFLYTTVLTLISPTGEEIDFEATKTGFRRIEIKQGVIYLNGVRMIFRGVNRHEHCLEFGRAVPREHMIKEIKLMKKLNFNGVRTCHYPDDPMWYELCDEYGICLVCEADVECHGSEMLSNDNNWASAYLERAMRMVLTHKNHASIFSWSMGNESRKGPHHAAMANWIRYYDNTRLVQYESGAPEAQISDLRGNMYAHPDYIVKMLADERDLRPIVLVEYLYQIRNSGGGMYIFAELLEKYKRFQGGFVWDWQDKCLVAKDKNGNTFPGYGGDFGEDFVEDTVPKHMTCNGVVLPDLTPKPVALEIKNVQSPVTIASVDSEKGKFKLKNRQLAWDTGHYKLAYSIIENGIEIYKSDVAMPYASPMSDTDFSVEIAKHLPQKKAGCEYFVNFYITLNEDTPWESKGYEVYKTQFALAGGATKVAEKISAKAAGISESDNEITVKGENFTARFDKKEGLMTLCEKGGVKYINSGAKETVCRPQTGLDSDFGWGFYNVWLPFYPENLTRKPGSIIAYNLPDGRVRVDVISQLVSSVNEYIIQSEMLLGDC